MKQANRMKWKRAMTNVGAATFDAAESGLALGLQFQL